MDVKLPDGTVIENVPDGTTQSDLMARVAKMRGPSTTDVVVNAANKGIAGLPDAILNTPQNLINLGKAGFGTAATAMGRSDLAPDITQPPSFVRKVFEKAGFIRPEAEPQDAKQRVIDAMVQSGASMALGPGKSTADMARNVVSGVLGGGAGAVTKEATGSEPLTITASMVAPLAPAAATRAVVGTPKPFNAVKADTLETSREKGYKVPGSETNDSFINNRLESIAGKAALKQQMGLANQENTNRLSAEDMGLPKGTAITQGEIDSYIARVSQPYRDVASLSPIAANALERLREARKDANAQWRFYDRSADPRAQKEAEALTAKAQMLEGVIEKVAAKSGKPELLDELRDARAKVARAHDYERALNEADANVSAPAMGRAFEKKPLSENAEVIGKFAKAFPGYATEGSRIPPPDVSKSEAISSAILGTMGYGAAGPGGLVAAGLPFISAPTRAMLMSDRYQRALTKSGMPPQEAAIRSLLIARAIAERNQQ